MAQGIALTLQSQLRERKSRSFVYLGQLIYPLQKQQKCGRFSLVTKVTPSTSPQGEAITPPLYQRKNKQTHCKHFNQHSYGTRVAVITCTTGIGSSIKHTHTHSPCILFGRGGGGGQWCFIFGRFHILRTFKITGKMFRMLVENFVHQDPEDLHFCSR